MKCTDTSHRQGGENEGSREAPIRPFRRRPTGIHRYRPLARRTEKKGKKRKPGTGRCSPERGARYNNGECAFAFILGPGPRCSGKLL